MAAKRKLEIWIASLMYIVTGIARMLVPDNAVNAQSSRLVTKSVMVEFPKLRTFAHYELRINEARKRAELIRVSFDGQSQRPEIAAYQQPQARGVRVSGAMVTNATSSLSCVGGGKPKPPLPGSTPSTINTHSGVSYGLTSHTVCKGVKYSKDAPVETFNCNVKLCATTGGIADPNACLTISTYTYHPQSAYNTGTHVTSQTTSNTKSGKWTGASGSSRSGGRTDSYTC